MKIKSARKVIDDLPIDIPSNGKSFVYFLILNDEVTYVGQTKKLSERLSCHQKSDKEFNRHTYIEVDDIYVDIIESCYIHSLKPRFNGNLNTGKTDNSPEKSAPITMSKISELLCEMADKEQKQQLKESDND